jgi:LysR family cyn operon transcriptional activator
VAHAAVEGGFFIESEAWPEVNTAMKRALRLLSLWDWLPTFRAVAEQEHVSRAAAALGVSPSAVSRMIGLLEEDIGQPLFDRVGRSIRLNDAGATLLGGVRSAMRLIDESLSMIEGTQFVGTLRIASAEPVTRAYLMPAIAAIRARHPGLVPSVRVAREDQVGPMLLQGAIDVGFVRRAISRTQLTLERMGEVGGGVYCGSGHPLHGAKRCSVAGVLEHPFVALDVESADRGGGWWPAEYRRKIALSIEAVDVAAEICAEGELLCVLPDVVVERHRQRLGADLYRLPLEIVRPTEVFAVWRERLELEGRAELLVEAVRAVFEGRDPAAELEAR